MRLKDIISTGLLPRFAADAAWMQVALDAWIRPSVEQFAALGAPFTLEAVQALTDDELQELYNEYNIVEYYPDLNRTTRELMIYNISILRRRLGTKAAVVALVQYAFDGLELSVDIYDNLAFNEAGELVDESLIDVYDVEITLSDAVLTDEIRNRLLKNIFRLVPDRLGLRNIIYTYPANCTQAQQVVVTGPETVVENDAVCEPVHPPEQNIEVIVGLCKRSITSSWLQVNLYNNWWYTILTNDTDVARLEVFGVPLVQNATTNVFTGAYMLALSGSSAFNYEIIEVYTDLGITPIAGYPVSELYFCYNHGSYITIDGSGYEGINRSDVMSVKCRITKLS